MNLVIGADGASSSIAELRPSSRTRYKSPIEVNMLPVKYLDAHDGYAPS